MTLKPTGNGIVVKTWVQIAVKGKSKTIERDFMQRFVYLPEFRFEILLVYLGLAV